MDEKGKSEQVFLLNILYMNSHDTSFLLPELGKAYMIEGGGSNTHSKAKKWLYQYPAASHKVSFPLLEILKHTTK